MKLPGLWLLEIPPVHPPDWENLLGPEEITRYHAIAAPLRKRQFLASRVLLRKALSAELGAAPETHKITAMAGERPRLLNSRQSVHISLAHSGLASACLLAESPCGVDIEEIAPERDFPGLAKIAFRDEVLEEFRKNPGRETFFRLWTEKEARSKAGAPCQWIGRMSFKNYRVCLALPLTGLKNLVFC
jgi:phosphopantetheinyl transferase